MARTILLVEDNPNDAELIAHVIESAGIQNPVHVAGTVQAAKEFLSGVTVEDSPVLAIIDVALPNGSGLDLLRWVRAHGPPISNLPAIIITGSFDRTYDRRSQQLGAIMFLQKPLDRDLFVGAIVHLGLRQTLT